MGVCRSVPLRSGTLCAWRVGVARGDMCVRSSRRGAELELGPRTLGSWDAVRRGPPTAVWCGFSSFRALTLTAPQAHAEPCSGGSMRSLRGPRGACGP